MDPIALARELRSIQIQLDAHLFESKSGSEPLEQVTIDDAYLTIDNNNQSQYPSSNRNRAQFLGVLQPAQAGSIENIIDIYRSRGIGRFFFWLSPSAQSNEIEGWLKQHSLQPFQGTGYPTLIRDTSPPEHRPTDLTIRRVSADEVRSVKQKVPELWGPSPETSPFLRTLGQKDIEHFLAFDHDLPVAAAMLCVHNQLGYLCNATTLETHRNRGAQSVLIETRITRAAELGCTTVVSETLYMLETSLNNLKRAGFHIAYDKEVWVWNP